MGAVVGSILELRIKGNVNGQQCMTSLHYRVSVQSTLPQITEENRILIDIQPGGTSTDIITPYSNLLSNTYNITSIAAQFVALTRTLNVETAVTIPGTNVSACPAQNVHGSILFRTLKSGKRYRSTLKPPGLPASFQTAGALTGPALTDFSAFGAVCLANIAGTIGGGVYVPVIWHRDITVLGQNYTDLAFAVPQTQVRTQYRRTVGIGK